MAIPTLDELRQWFDRLEPDQRICRVMVRTESYAHVCGREAVGIDRLGGRNGLVCEQHKPRVYGSDQESQFFVRLKS
jgi:hypothetical protein